MGPATRYTLLRNTTSVMRIFFFVSLFVAHVLWVQLVFFKKSCYNIFEYHFYTMQFHPLCNIICFEFLFTVLITEFLFAGIMEL